MVDETWGFLGPSALANERRTRTLGVGSSVRAFNDLAVPGLGNVWFGKQLFLAALGIAVAERVRQSGKRIQNVQAANAIEALACRLGLAANEWKPDPRLRGAMKLKGKNDLSFAVVGQRGFYVTQPMRMATVQALPTLGLVHSEGSRFNAFAPSRHGDDFIDAACAAHNPCYYSKSVPEYLAAWVAGAIGNIASNGKLQAALSPLEPMDKAACEILRERLIQGNGRESTLDTERRRAALAWVDAVRSAPDQIIDWRQKPSAIDIAHWDDMHAGALFFTARDAAINALMTVEAHIVDQSAPALPLNKPLPAGVRAALDALRAHAATYLAQEHKDGLANNFCRECVEKDDAAVLAKLVTRDNHVLRLREHGVTRNPALAKEDLDRELPAAADEADSPVAEGKLQWPPGISHRVPNLFLLNLDLHGELADSLAEADIPNGETGGAQ